MISKEVQEFASYVTELDKFLENPQPHREILDKSVGGLKMMYGLMLAGDMKFQHALFADYDRMMNMLYSEIWHAGDELVSSSLASRRVLDILKKALKYHVTYV